MNVWEKAILRSIHSRGGQADTRQIYDDMESGTFIVLTKEHLKKTEHGGRPKYQHQVRSHLSNLKQAGDVDKAERGKYSITKQGKIRIG